MWVFRNSADEGLYLATIGWCRFSTDSRQNDVGGVFDVALSSAVVIR